MITKTLYTIMIFLLLVKILNIMGMPWLIVFLPLFIWVGLVVLCLAFIGIIAILSIEND